MAASGEVEFNFPLFPLSNKDVAVYFSRLEISSEFEISSSGKKRPITLEVNIFLIPEAYKEENYSISPIADIENTVEIISKIIKERNLPENINSVTTEFSLRKNHSLFFVYMFSDNFSDNLAELVAISFKVQKENSQSYATFFLFIPFEVAKQVLGLESGIESLSLKVMKIHVNIRYLQDTKIRVNIRRGKHDGYYSSSEAVVYSWRILQRRGEPYQTVYPFIVSVPELSLLRLLNREFSKEPGKLKVYLVRDLLVQSLLGSWLILKERDRSVQFEHIIPTSLVGKLLKLLKDSETVEPLNAFSNVTFSAATFVLRVDLSSLFNDVNGIIRKVDPKAILKSLVHSQVMRAFLVSRDSEANIKIFGIAPITQRSFGINVGVGGEVFRLKYRYLKTKRLEDFLLSLEKRRGTERVRDGEKLLSLARDIIEEEVEKKLKSTPDSIEYRYKGSQTREEHLRKLVVLSLAELGLHAISHLFMHFLHDTFNIPVSKMREAVVLEISRKILGDRRRSRTGTLIDGYIYYVVRDSDDVPRGYVLITVDEDFSFESIKNSEFIKARFKERDSETLYLENAEIVAKQLLNRIGHRKSDDPCYKLWERHYRLYHRTLQAILENQPKKVREIINEVILVDYCELDSEREERDKTPEPYRPEPYRWLYYPLSQFRRLLVRVAREYAEDDNTRKVLIARMKTFANAIYMACQPICFDGCYNCTMVKPRYCGTKNHLLEDWLTSKDAARLILNSTIRDRNEKQPK